MEALKKHNRLVEITDDMLEKTQLNFNCHFEKTGNFANHLAIKAIIRNNWQLAKIQERNERKARLKQLSKEVEFDLILEQNARG